MRTTSTRAGISQRHGFPQNGVTDQRTWLPQSATFELLPSFDATISCHNRKMRNFHLPLTDEVYDNLRQEAVRSNRPATALARQAIELWLKERRKSAQHEAISAFAAEHSGTTWDLDADFEAASIEHLLDSHEGRH